MSIAETTSEPDLPTPDGQRDPTPCVHCGTPMAEDQEWCLDCGAARTLIHRPPDWRVPVAVIGTVVVLAVAALAVALINLSGSSDPGVITRTVIARAPGTSRSPTTRAKTNGAKTNGAKTKPSSTGASKSAAGTPARTPSTNPPGIASWPVALSEWTVVLARYSDQVTANGTALRVKTEGLPVGVLNASDHASLSPGGWIVFTGRYPDRAQAVAAAQLLRAHGHTARARLVAPTAGQ